uniref:hypothetical protein n=1 Tax=Nitrosomonas sp. TaxID=42353 RepID=UPI00374CECB8
NQANAAKNYTLSLDPGILSGKKATHIETDIANAAIVSGNLSASLTANQIQTHRLQPRAISAVVKKLTQQ